MLRASAIIEKAGIPTASLVCDGFLGQAAAIRSGLGVPDMPLARIVGHVDTQSAEELTGNLQRVTTPDVIARLTQAPDADETAPPDAKTGDEDEIVARGSFEEINATFEDRQWTDGLPVVPPTREKVDAFLGHAADAPDWEIGVFAAVRADRHAPECGGQWRHGRLPAGVYACAGGNHGSAG